MDHYKTDDELTTCSTPDLLKYRKYLNLKIKDTRESIKILGTAWVMSTAELRLRAKNIQTELATLETKRIDATTDKEYLELDLQ